MSDLFRHSSQNNRFIGFTMLTKTGQTIKKKLYTSNNDEQNEQTHSTEANRMKKKMEFLNERNLFCERMNLNNSSSTT